MDPLSITASIAGLLSLSGQLYTVFNEYLDAHANAPRHVRLVLDEITSLQIIFRQVQQLIDNSLDLDESRTSMVRGADLVTILTGCVCAYSLLEKEILSGDTDNSIFFACYHEEYDKKLKGVEAMLGPGASKWAKNKAMWAYRKRKPLLVAILQDLRDHKANLSLMLMTINCQTSSEALSAIRQLNASMKSLRMARRDVPRRAQALMSRGEHPADLVECHDSDQSSMTSSSGMSMRSISVSFEKILRSSRPYKSTIVWNDGLSLNSSAMKHTKWTSMSDMSLSEISNIAVIDLPIYPVDLWSYEAYGIDERASSQRNLLAAAMANDYEGVVTALEEGAHVDSADSCNQTALMIAAQYGYLPIARLLLERGANTEAIYDDFQNTQTVIVIAAQSGQDKIIELLLEFGANINGGNSRALYRAVCHNYDSTVRLLISNGIDVNRYRTPDYEESALHQAAKDGQSNMVRILLNHGANVKAKNRFFKTPRRLASERGHREIVALLT